MQKEKSYTVITNAMGDIAALYTTDGTLIGTYDYDPYGNVTGVNETEADTNHLTQKNPFRYRGYYYDSETGWYYLNSRYYDPVVKRFISADSPKYLGVGDDINSYNLYVYCGGNPINGIDPSGCFDIGGFFTGVGIAVAGVAIAVTAPAWASVAAVAVAATGTVMAIEAAVDGVMTMDLSVSIPFVVPASKMPAYGKVGCSLLLDFKNDEAVAYGHWGGGTGISGGLSYSVGKVFDYTEPKSYEGLFGDLSIGNIVGVDYCRGPNLDSSGALSITFGTGITFSGGADNFSEGNTIFSW